MIDHSHTGTLTEHAEYTRLTFRRRLPHPIDAVWAAITDPVERAAWFGETSHDDRTGGTIEMVPAEPPAAPEAKRMTGRILVWDPPHVFEHEWNQRIVESSVVRYELTKTATAPSSRSPTPVSPPPTAVASSPAPTPSWIASRHTSINGACPAGQAATSRSQRSTRAGDRPPRHACTSG